jgi:hypothetical protein
MNWKVYLNLKNMTIALIIALSYEILLKLSRQFIPLLFHNAPVINITQVLSLLTGIIIILFIILFYKQEGTDKKVKLVLKILIGLLILHFILKLPQAGNLINYKTARLAREIIGFIQAVLLFLLLIFYQSEISPGEKLFKQVAIFLTVIFGITIFRNLFSLIFYTYFIISGISVTFSPLFYQVMFFLFLITQVTIIWFLYGYYQFRIVAG